jgi:GT2 family glycosyltransferase
MCRRPPGDMTEEIQHRARSEGQPCPSPPGGRPRLHVLLTVHDRKAKTLACLERVEAQRADAGADLSVVMVDDGSTDGTAQAVRARFPDVRVVPGSGQLYWSGGMRLAFEVAHADDPDFYLLLNDDTYLLPGALRTLLAVHDERTRAEGRPCLVTGSSVDPATGRQSYGGWRRGPALSPTSLTRIPPGREPLPCDTMHGNCVLVPREVVRRIGLLDAVYTHAMGDLDYGFRARRAGLGLWIAPGYLAECQENDGRGLFVEAALAPRERWRRLLGPKGLPPRAWLTFNARHGGPLWPLTFCWPYLKSWLPAARSGRPAAGGHS